MPAIMGDIGFLDDLENNLVGSGDEGSGEAIVTDSGWTGTLITTEEPMDYTHNKTTGLQLLEIDSDLFQIRDVFVFVYFILIVLGTLGNFTCVFTLLCKSLRRHSVVTLFILLCLVDTVTLWGHLIEVLTVYIPELILNPWTCRVVFMVTRYGCIVSAFIIVMLSIERMMYHGRPTTSEDSNKLFTPANSWKLFALMTVMVLGITCHGFWTVTATENLIPEVMTCLFNTTDRYIRFWLGWWILENCLLSFVPLLLIGLMTSIMLINNSKPTSDKLADESSPSSIDSNTKVTMAISVSFLLLITPNSIFDIYLKNMHDDYTPSLDISTTTATSTKHLKIAKLICYALVLIFHGFKLMLFCCFSKHFVHQLKCNEYSAHDLSDYEQGRAEFEYIGVVDILKSKNGDDNANNISSATNSNLESDEKKSEATRDNDSAFLSRTPSTASNKADLTTDIDALDSACYDNLVISTEDEVGDKTCEKSAVCNSITDLVGIKSVESQEETPECNSPMEGGEGATANPANLNCSNNNNAEIEAAELINTAKEGSSPDSNSFETVAHVEPMSENTECEPKPLEQNHTESTERDIETENISQPLSESVIKESTSKGEPTITLPSPTNSESSLPPLPVSNTTDDDNIETDNFPPPPPDSIIVAESSETSSVKSNPSSEKSVCWAEPLSTVSSELPDSAKLISRSAEFEDIGVNDAQNAEDFVKYKTL